MSCELTVADHGEVRVLTFDRPGSLNAFSEGLYEAVRDGLEEAKVCPGVSVVVLTGAGSVFSAGRDLVEAAGSPPEQQAGRNFGSFVDALATFDKPLLAAVNGPAVGVGATLLLHCDLVYLSTEARIRFPFAHLGMVPEAGSSVLLPARIGRQVAARLLFTGAWLGAAEAVECGFAQEAYEPGELLDRVLAIAGDIVSASPGALVAAKRLLVAGAADLVATARRREDSENARLAGDPGRLAALAAFKRRAANASAKN